MSRRKKIIDQIKPYIKNKYFLAGFFFVIWVSLFDENNLLERIQLNREYKQLQEDKEYYMKRIEIDSKRLKELKTDKKNLEKFAREQYLMKRENEDVFVIVKE